MKYATCTTRWSAVAQAGASLLLLGASCVAQLPSTCKAPPALATALSNSPSAKAYDAAGAWFAEHDRLPCALASFSKAVSLQPGSAEAQYNLGLANLGLKHNAEAEQHLRLALTNDSHLLAARTALGTLLLDENRPAEAEAEFRQVAAAEEASVPALDNVGLALAAQGRYAAAIRTWNEALALKPGAPEILLSVATATYKNGDAEGAITLLKALTENHPEYADAHLTLANILAASLLYGEAATQFREVLRLDPADDAATLSYAKALSNAGYYKEAQPPADEFVRRRPADPEGHLVLGSIYRRLTDYDKAEEQLKIAATAEPNNAQAQYELGLSMFRSKHLVEALPHLEKAFALNPSDAPTDFALAGALRGLGDIKRANEVTETMRENKEKERNVTLQTVDGNQANAFLQAGEPAQAIEIYRRMLTLDPKNARTKYNLALALGAVQDPKGEREALQDAVRLDPHMAVAESELGLMDLAAGDAHGAEEKLHTALTMNPQYAPAEGNLGLIYASRHETGAAEKMFRQAIEDDPLYVQGYLNLGLMLASRQDFRGAEALLEHARELAPNEARVLSALAKVEVRLGKTDEALVLFRKNATLSPRNAEAHIELAIALADGYDLGRALEETELAIQLAPASASGYFNRGRILFDLGRSSEARQSLEAASKLAPTQPDPLYYLALVEKQEGNFPGAADLFQKVVKAQPGNVTAFYFLGLCLQSSSKQQAIAAWQHAAALNPDYTPALWSLTRALSSDDPTQAKRYDAQLKLALTRSHSQDEAELTANNAIAAMEAHDWTAALKGMQDALQVCGDCAAKASLHKSLGLAYCHAGDLVNGEKELRYAETLKGGDPDIQRALELIAHAKGFQG